MSNCRKQKQPWPSWILIGCEKSFARNCSYSIAGACDSSVGLYRPSPMGFIIQWAGVDACWPLVRSEGLPLRCLSSFVKEASLAPACTFRPDSFWRRSVCFLWLRLVRMYDSFVCMFLLLSCPGMFMWYRKRISARPGFRCSRTYFPLGCSSRFHCANSGKVN